MINPGDGVVDNGEWISWNEINEHVFKADEGELFERLVEVAKDYYDFTDRHLPIYGELGELYAERRFGIERNKPNAAGSDGRIGAKLFEIKTITPAKGDDVVRVKRSGNFGALVIVKIDGDFRFDARIIERSELPKGGGKFIRVSWQNLSPEFSEA